MSHSEQAKRAEENERRRVTAEELSWALRGANRAAAEVDHALSTKIAVRPLDYSAIGHVMSQEGDPLGPAELGNRLGISTGSATELVDRLERAGHLIRVRDGKDRRRVHLRPTEEAVDRILGELRPLFDSLDAITTEFTSEEQQAIGRYLRLATERLADFADHLADSTAPGRPHTATHDD
ncbi:MarR family winged helix-turn-helix transcriptional regulator [Arthrobacter sp. AET 35A]|uniref:MarR family winged helix-turn-helix transcriptional regulator n=1 Tax=Arthrobacter sp. AET 35A TaxID=2292643 RepID=UPI00177E870D|nr:MarR family transcriptional regulator [Arthrobacter sp. AET 35A]MBE0011306.1 MarR family transcriptional regulator [Arthrobacter sp. AET 35A]